MFNKKYKDKIFNLEYENGLLRENIEILESALMSASEALAFEDNSIPQQTYDELIRMAETEKAGK